MKQYKILMFASMMVISFTLGVVYAYNCIKNDTTISINGKRVDVVDVMYQYNLEDGREVYGDYSLVSKQGYEFTEDGDYTNEYSNATIIK